MDRFGGRKFVFAFLLTVLFGAFTFTGKMTIEQFMSASLVAYGLFAGANAFSKRKM